MCKYKKESVLEVYTKTMNLNKSVSGRKDTSSKQLMSTITVSGTGMPFNEIEDQIAEM